MMVSSATRTLSRPSVRPDSRAQTGRPCSQKSCPQLRSLPSLAEAPGAFRCVLRSSTAPPFQHLPDEAAFAASRPWRFPLIPAPAAGSEARRSAGSAYSRRAEPSSVRINTGGSAGPAARSCRQGAAGRGCACPQRSRPGPGPWSRGAAAAALLQVGRGARPPGPRGGSGRGGRAPRGQRRPGRCAQPAAAVALGDIPHVQRLPRTAPASPDSPGTTSWFLWATCLVSVGRPYAGSLR